MKTKICIFASLLCMYEMQTVYASDCIGDECEIMPINVIEMEESVEVYEQPVWDMPNITEPQAIIIPEHNIRVYSVKPTEKDDRPQLWDGVHGQYDSKTSAAKCFPSASAI